MLIVALHRRLFLDVTDFKALTYKCVLGNFVKAVGTCEVGEN